MTKNEDDKITRSDLEWREMLTDEQYRITREHGTEPAFSNPLNDEKRDGLYSCICCEADLFRSDDKFDSGTGWPSYFQPLHQQAISEHSDGSFFMRRTGIRCSNCDAHLGHVFKDGPVPTGLRYCMNGTALSFKPK